MTNHADRVRVLVEVLAAIALVATVASATSSSAATARPPAVGRQAKDFTLTELGGGAVELSQVTKAGPVVLVVLRGYPGYQCPICTRQFGRLGHVSTMSRCSERTRSACRDEVGDCSGANPLLQRR